MKTLALGLTMLLAIAARAQGRPSPDAGTARAQPGLAADAGTARGLQRPGSDAGAAQPGQAAHGPSATITTELKDGRGKPVGKATLSQTPSGLLIRAKLSGMPPGAHAFHIHEAPLCEPPKFTSAGGHYNPGAAQHGFHNPKGAHAGDLPNLYVPRSGELEIEALNCSEVRLDQLLQKGAALVVHASADDYHSDPAGGAGDRIACGVIAKK